ncbi:MAG: tRNA epoxyqueuosine(34) reductase QueG [Neomegalonema sp.]|nr:tRNA epoxyqueuosine(34) reductase QueG [Neomegalonema sp.]
MGRDDGQIATVASQLRDRAAAEGLVGCRITTPDAVVTAGERLLQWLADGRHGELSWMAERSAWRADPRELWPEARSVVLFGEPYGPDDDPLGVLQRSELGAISVYARNRDYHDVLKKKLKQIGRGFIEDAEDLTGARPEIKVFVDTAPVMEKPLAYAAGLGWQGKHTNLVSRTEGSWLFIGAMFTTLKLPADAAERDHCGSCRRCLDICPTAAFPAPYQLDARRCISYLTIELKGPIPRPMRPLIGNRIYGCDDCLAVCPWNKFAENARDAAYWARVELRAPYLEDLAQLDEPGFRELFSGSPIKRIGWTRFMRNVLIAIGNSGRVELTEAAALQLDASSPLLRGAAIWALGRLDPARALAERGEREGLEPEPSVLEEWRALPG